MTVKASALKTGDIVLIPGNFPPLFPFYLIMKPFTRGYRHSLVVYGNNGRGDILAMESILRCGPTVSPMAKYFGKEVEVYRINHLLAEVFIWAILAAGDEILKVTYTFFDYFLLFPRAVIAYLGFSGRIGHKYFPFYFCSEFLQICFEKAPNFIKKAVKAMKIGTSSGLLQSCFEEALQFIEDDFDAMTDIYRNDILAKFPKGKLSKSKIRLMAPYDFKDLSFLKLVGKGTLVDE